MDKVIDQSAIAALDITLESIAQAIGDAFLAGASGDITWNPKLMLAGTDGAFQMSTFASWKSRDLSIFHMLFGPTADAMRAGAPGYLSRQFVVERQSGVPLALLDGTFTSNMLPAGITRLLCGRLARFRTGIATLIGAGTQARLNLVALEGVLPIKEVRIVTRTQKSAEAFADFVRQRGQTPVIMQVGPEALNEADIVISTIPATPNLKPMLDPAWVSPGTFVNVVDLGRSWMLGFEAFERTVIDDRQQAEQQYQDGRLSHRGPFDSEIADLLGGVRPGRIDDDERIALIHPGNVVGVLGVTAVIIRHLQALERVCR